MSKDNYMSTGQPVKPRGIAPTKKNLINHLCDDGYHFEDAIEIMDVAFNYGAQALHRAFHGWNDGGSDNIDNYTSGMVDRIETWVNRVVQEYPHIPITSLPNIKGSCDKHMIGRVRFTGGSSNLGICTGYYVVLIDSIRWYDIIPDKPEDHTSSYMQRESNITIVNAINEMDTEWFLLHWHPKVRQMGLDRLSDKHQTITT